MCLAGGRGFRRSGLHAVGVVLMSPAAARGWWLGPQRGLRACVCGGCVVWFPHGAAALRVNPVATRTLCWLGAGGAVCPHRLLRTCDPLGGGEGYVCVCMYLAGFEAGLWVVVRMSRLCGLSTAGLSSPAAQHPPAAASRREA